MDFFNRVKGNKSAPTEAESRTMQIKREIESLEVRKGTTQSVADKEKAVLNQEKEKVFNEVGKTAYNNYLENKSVSEGLDDYWKKIEAIDTQISLKDDKLKEMLARFDDEINIMNTELKYLAPVLADPTPIVAESQGNAFCQYCGAPIKEGDKFCEKCGGRL